MRGSRGVQNSRKMLEPLLKGKYAHCSEVFLYHTPKLRGLLKVIMPDRYNEVIGLQHMKLYMIDDTLIISGYVRMCISNHFIEDNINEFYIFIVQI